MQLLDLDSSAPRQSFDWIVELGARLNLVIEVLDVYDTPVSPVGSTRDAAVVRTLITNNEPSLRSAMSAAVRSRTPVSVAIEGMQFVCFRLAGGGVVLLARRLESESEDAADECREDLQSIGPWLTGAIDSSLAQPNTVSAEGYRLVSFRRILREASSRGSLRQVVGAFIEALSVWDDVRVRAYVGGASGGFFEYASSMTAASSSDFIDEAILPRAGYMIRLTRADVDQAGLTLDPGDTVIARMEIGSDTAWVLVFSGMINDAVQVRLRVYADILRESLNDVLTTSTSRIVAELSRRQAPVNEPLGAVAHAALERLSSAVGARQAGLLVTTTAGRQALAVGNGDLLSSLDRVRGTRLLVRSADPGGVMTVVFDRDHTAFTAFEREIAQAGVAAMQPWIEAALPRSNDVERRGSARPVETVFDQLATDAVAAGHHASMIVVTIDSAMASPGLLPSWVARIRARLRAGDRAGMLNEREIAVLLYGASAEQAALVSSRLEQLLEARGGTPGSVAPSIGVTTRVPDSPFEGSLVAAARASAAARP